LNTEPKRVLPDLAIFAIVFAAEFLAHYPLLRLPYFWDEAGYYIPAARDLLQTGSLIPLSAPSNAHPPLVMAYLAMWWKISGTSAMVTRTAMLTVSTFALLGLFRLAARVSNRKVAWAAVACTAVYPVFFTQSSMAHVDLAAAAFTFWALDAFLAERPLQTAVWFSLSVMAKETALLAPVALLAWSVLCPLIPALRPASVCRGKLRLPMISALLAPLLVLVGWYGYHFAKTGYVFGNPEFFRYNVQATMSPLRIFLALGMRLWQTFGYLHLFVLTLLMVWAMTASPLTDDQVERPRIAVATQCLFGIVTLAYVTAMAVIGGAVLARYMLPVVPLVILVCVSTLWRRKRYWPALAAGVIIAFVAGLFTNPPYGFALEDNLAYRDYIQMHQRAASLLEAHPPRSAILTAWPGSDELTRPYLGYVTRPLRVIRAEDFSPGEIIAAARAESLFDAAFLFPTKYEPEHPFLAHWAWWRSVKERYFGYHQDLPPAAVSNILGGQIILEEHRHGQWVAVIQIEKAEDAKEHSDLQSHQVAGMRLDNEPDLELGNKPK
jgi:hypothetical protein